MDELDLYFSSLMAMSVHPGWVKYPSQKPTTEQLLATAIEMVKLKENYREEEWRISQQAQQSQEV